MYQKRILFSAAACGYGTLPTGEQDGASLDARSKNRLDCMIEDAISECLGGNVVAFAFGAGALNKRCQPLCELQMKYVVERWQRELPFMTLVKHLPSSQDRLWGTEDEVEFAQSIAEEYGYDELRYATEDYHCPRTEYLLEVHQTESVDWILLKASSLQNPATAAEVLHEEQSLWSRKHLPAVLYWTLQKLSRLRQRMKNAL